MQVRENASCEVYDFVGFLTNEDNDLMAVFPKHFAVQNPEADAALLFRVINRHRQRRPDCYIGERYGEAFSSDYPFAAFFGIYEYYSRFGLYVQSRQFVKPGTGGRVSWRDTLRLAGIYLSGEEPVLYPLYHRTKYVFSDFLTECMIFAIDYTLEKFGCFLGLPRTGRAFPETDFLSEREAVTETLIRLREGEFRDEQRGLFDHLIAYFSSIREGGGFYFKFYGFSSVWEDMVREYLNRNFSRATEQGMVFDRRRAAGLTFEKTAFCVNLAAPGQRIEPDAYAVWGEEQYILDAKYYTAVGGLDYKQTVYHMFLCGMKRGADGENPLFRRTHTALVLPGRKRESRLHLKPDPRFGRGLEGVRIWEEYLDIREVMEDYDR